MKKSNMKGFTLVELLAVIVILAIILVIAVPKVMSVIEDAKKATLESTAKMIASQAEKQKVQNTVLGNNEAITCKDITNINDVDYASCEITFDDNTAKVTITGSGKFEGLFVCNGTKTSAVATKDSCTPVVTATNFADDDWSTIVAAVKQAETKGTEYPYNIGDEKTIDLGTTLGTHTIRVANTTKCSEVTVESQTACGFVLEFADIITTHEMNGDPVNYTGETNAGGWPTSEMRAYLNDLDANTDEDGVIYNALPEELRNAIIDTYVISSHGKEDTSTYENVVDGNFYSNDKLYLLSPQEVYGTSFTDQYDSSNGTSRQLDYYATYEGEGYTGVSSTNFKGTKKYQGGKAKYWWLRSTNSYGSNRFYVVSNIGSWSNASVSYYSYGVAPAFRLAE